MRPASFTASGNTSGIRQIAKAAGNFHDVPAPFFKEDN